MMRKLGFIAFFLMAVQVRAQQVTIYGLNGVNSLRNELFCLFHHDTLVFASDANEDLIGDLERSQIRNYSIYRAAMKENLTEYKNPVAWKLISGDGDVGPMVIDEISHSYYFSTSNDLGAGNRGRISIYHTQKNANEDFEMSPFVHNAEGFHSVHPYLSSSGDKLLFSSNRTGSTGGMDIWFCIREADGKWSLPIHLDTELNTSSNELFPMERNGDIYFASDREGGYGGYDIYKATKSSQWRNVIRLEPPFNSNRDDMQIHYLDDLSGFICSARDGGMGGDDLYYFEIQPLNEERGVLSALLECKGTAIPNARILIYNTKNELLSVDSTNTDGRISLDGFSMNHKYKLKVEGVAPEILRNTLMYILDESDRKIRVYRFNEDGFFVFEMLPFDNLSSLDFVENIDESVLNIGLSGYIYKEEKGDVGAGEAVYALDKNGEMLQLAYTDPLGNFSMTGIRPEPVYRFKTEEEMGDAHLVILDKGKQHNVPLKGGVGEYARSEKGQGMALVDEGNEDMWIDLEDVFVVKRLYYAFNSDELNERAKIELDKISRIMLNNPAIHIALGSHTDSRGDDKYNLLLSERRSKKAAQYIVQNGIDRQRIEALGYGETKLLNDCGNGADCSEDLHALNRRTEIIIYLVNNSDQ